MFDVANQKILELEEKIQKQLDEALEWQQKYYDAGGKVPPRTESPKFGARGAWESGKLPAQRDRKISRQVSPQMGRKLSKYQGATASESEGSDQEMDRLSRRSKNTKVLTQSESIEQVERQCRVKTSI